MKYRFAALIQILFQTPRSGVLWRLRRVAVCFNTWFFSSYNFAHACEHVASLVTNHFRFGFQAFNLNSVTCHEFVEPCRLLHQHLELSFIFCGCLR